MCHETFNTETTELELVSEAERDFGECPPEGDRASLCDECYKKFMKWFNRVRPDLNPESGESS